MTTETGVCVLCCCDYDQVETPPGGDEDDRSCGIARLEEMALCSSCRPLISKAVTSKVKLEETEMEIRLRQREVLGMLQKLDGQLTVQHEGMVRTEREVLRHQRELLRTLRMLEGLMKDFQVAMAALSPVIQGSNANLMKCLRRTDLSEEDKSEIMRSRTHAFKVVTELQKLLQVASDAKNRRLTWLSIETLERYNPKDKLGHAGDLVVKTEEMESEKGLDAVKDTTAPVPLVKIEPCSEDDDDHSDNDSVSNADDYNCYAIFLLKASPAKVKRRKRNDNHPCDCDICGKPFLLYSSMKDHRLTHMTEEEKAEATQSYKFQKFGRNPIVRTYPCSTCGKLLPAKRLKKHEHTHAVKATCEKCGQGFTNQITLTSHVKTCGRLPEDLMHKCNLCDRTFKALSSLKYHQVRVHNPEDLLVCSICGKKFADKYSLKEHEVGHSKPFHCPKNCGNSFKTKNGCAGHAVLCDGKGVTNMQPVECPICKRVIKNKSKLGRHIKARHGTESKEPRQYLSTHCPQIFSNSQKLKYHLVRVSGERPHLCRKGCGAGFGMTKTRATHEKSCKGNGTHHGRRPTYVVPPKASSS